MAPAVAGEEDDGLPSEAAHAVGVGGLAKRRLHLHPADILEAVHLVEAAAPDHSHRDLSVIPARRLAFHASASSSTPKVRSVPAAVIRTRAKRRARSAGPPKSTST